MRAAVLGGAGYIGGELVRLLVGHPHVQLATVTSTRLGGRRVDSVHPNLRGATDLTFTAPADLGRHDVVLVATPHLRDAAEMAGVLERAAVVIDLTADHRLTDPAAYVRHYGTEHPAPDLLGTFCRGLPESHREQLRTADRVSVPGCMATAAILALGPLVADGLVDGTLSVDARTGSSGSGATSGDAGRHAERAGTMRVFAPAGHRHAAEIEQALGHQVAMSATGVEAVRGVQVLCRAATRAPVTERDLRASYRRHYAAEPFVRVVARSRGLYRQPEPKILSGSNFCDVGFAALPELDIVVAIAALDNLMKGGAGNAVQCMNIRFGWPETSGLEFLGLHPV
ncbi:N-acetyl-gamma-glutamyl-phosphate reductase [Jatrophihabitans endophyticus]|uniref:N-acetyl-gamma-glutamyl-phosphate reductase n=1 Tax=Jatrophihabitans endophyticus TaxID=1206085 RepID=A0A1M5CQX0_9ACTN|nr:N-acetyl-gamma-glutamyl-phosphate reductase [Jatrophihabitans endophyticus]